MPRSSPEVVIVGAGPAGSVCATLLARRGCRVVLVDRARFPRHKACAEYLSPGVLAILRRLGLGAALEGALPVPGMDIISPRGTRFRLHYGDEPGAVHAATLPRRVLDAALLDAAARCGVEVVQGFVARAPVVEGEAVRGVTGSVEGREVRVEAPLTLVADGSRSTLARALGLAKPAHWPVRLGLVAHYEGAAELDAGFGQMHVDPEGYCGVAPLPGGLVNVSVVVPLDALRRRGASASAYLDTWVASRPRLRQSLASCRRATPVRGVGPVGVRASRAWTPGALLVGDAAGFFDPFTGEGIYRAVRGAELAGEVAYRALIAGDVSGRSLGAYDGMRTSAFRRKEGVTRLVQLFVQFPALMEYGLPRLSRRPAPAQTLSAVLGDIAEAERFLRPAMLWSALHP